MIIDNSLSSEERLKSKILIARIFSHGKSTSSSPLRLIYLKLDPKAEITPGLIQIMVSVSKKLFPKAVDRNAIKRQLREAYRTQKHLLTPLKAKLGDEGLTLALLFTEKQKVEQSIILENLALLLNNLVSEYG